MHSESSRLLSFNNWPHPPTFQASPLKLSKSGFFHSPTDNYNDRVVCFCCGIALVHWNNSHDPWNEHCLRSPSCGVVTGTYARFCKEADRLASFHNWPLPANFAATPQKLAMAGFLHVPSTAYQDRCICFCCGIALVKWEKDDDPWHEHQSHSKNCPFITNKDVGNVPIEEIVPEEKIDSTMMRLIEKLDEMGIDASADAGNYLICPITQDIMVDPVVAEDGHSYEREAIKKWFQNKNTSPLTNKPLYSKRLIPNHNLRSQLIDFAEGILARQKGMTQSICLKVEEGKKAIPTKIVEPELVEPDPVKL